MLQRWLLVNVTVANNFSDSQTAASFSPVQPLAVTVGHLSYTINAGVSFTIPNASGGLKLTINWLIVEPAP